MFKYFRAAVVYFHISFRAIKLMNNSISNITNITSYYVLKKTHNTIFRTSCIAFGPEVWPLSIVLNLNSFINVLFIFTSCLISHFYDITLIKNLTRATLRLDPLRGLSRLIVMYNLMLWIQHANFVPSLLSPNPFLHLVHQDGVLTKTLSYTSLWISLPHLQ